PNSPPSPWNEIPSIPTAEKPASSATEASPETTRVAVPSATSIRLMPPVNPGQNALSGGAITHSSGGPPGPAPAPQDWPGGLKARSRGLSRPDTTVVNVPAGAAPAGDAASASAIVAASASQACHRFMVIPPASRRPSRTPHRPRAPAYVGQADSG